MLVHHVKVGLLLELSPKQSGILIYAYELLYPVLLAHHALALKRILSRIVVQLHGLGVRKVHVVIVLVLASIPHLTLVNLRSLFIIELRLLEGSILGHRLLGRQEALASNGDTLSALN